MKSTKSPYLKENRLADVVAAIQVMAVYPWASRQVDAWTKKLGDTLSADSWSTVFREHPKNIGVKPTLLTDLKHRGQAYTFQMRRLKPARWWECESPTVKV